MAANFPTVTVRRATREDIPSLCTLENECFSSPWSERSFADFFDSDSSAAYTAVEGNRVVGYLGLYESFGDAEITNIAVTQSVRRQGVADALLAAVKADGYQRLLLEVRVSNTAARALYEKHGFHSDGVRRGFYTKPTEDAVLMSLVLPAVLPNGTVNPQCNED